MQVQITPQLLCYTLPHHTITIPLRYLTVHKLYLTSLYHYFTYTSTHSAGLDLTNTIITSRHITLPLLYPHAAQPHIYFTLILYQINVYLFSTVRYNTLPSLNFALTKPNFMEFNITLTKHSNTNLSHTLPMLLCTKLK